MGLLLVAVGIICAGILFGTAILILIMRDEKKHPAPGFTFSLCWRVKVILQAPLLYSAFMIALGGMYLLLGLECIKGMIQCYMIPFFSSGRYTTGGDLTDGQDAAGREKK